MIIFYDFLNQSHVSLLSVKLSLKMKLKTFEKNIFLEIYSFVIFLIF